MSCCIIGCPNRGLKARKDVTYHLFPHPVKGATASRIQNHNRYTAQLSSKYSCFFRFRFSDVMRFKRWLQACNNENVATKPPMLVYKQYRICRRHFDASSMNGGCRRLLKTAVPKLHLNLDQTCSIAEHDDDAIDLPMEMDGLTENLMSEEDDDGGGIQEPVPFETFEIKYDPTAGKSSQRRDIRECDTIQHQY